MARKKKIEDQYDDPNDIDLDGLLPGKKSHKDLFDRIDSISSDNYETDGGFSTSTFLPSSFIKKEEKKKEDKTEYENSEYSADEWFNNLMDSSSLTINKKGKLKGNLFETIGLKKKKKKKKDKSDLVDYKKELSTEMALYKNLLVDQTAFTESLQKEYDRISQSKGSYRGITKQMTDLIDNINSARSLSMQLVEKNVNAKKLIAELTMKQKKELAGGADADNLVDFASSYLKQMVNDRQAVIASGLNDSTIVEYDDDSDDLIMDLDESLSIQDAKAEELAKENGLNFEKRSDETDLYIKYENLNLTTYVVIQGDDIQDYEFVTKDSNGNVISDYPMPLHTEISVNKSTGMATDSYGAKYPIIWR